MELDVQGSRKRDPNAPGGSDPTPPAGGPNRVALGYALGRRHSLAHLYAKRSPQSGSWAKWDLGWAGHVPGHVPRLAGPGRRAVQQPARGRTGWA